MSKKKTLTLPEQIKKMAHARCASFINGECCFGHPCKYDDTRAEGDELPRCRYFETHVLPARPALEQAYKESRGIDAEEDEEKPSKFCDNPNQKKCKDCCKSYIRTAPNQLYCPECAEKRKQDARRRASREWRRRKRELKA